MSEQDDDTYSETAGDLVDMVINKAIERLTDLDIETENRNNNAADKENTSSVQKDDYQVKDITWLTIAEFTEERGVEKINDFIKTWEYEGSWQYCVDFLSADQHEFDTRYRYRVRWSIPTRRKPIPRATACVYFTFQVSKIKPKSHPVQVFYVFETNRLVHRPGQSRFREKWLKDIIESKVLLMAAVNF